MKNSIDFIKGFLGRAGSYVFSSAVISRGLSFLTSWIAIKLIDTKELGAVIFAFQIIAFILPLAGFGLNQGLLRYGSLVKSNLEKNNLFVYTLKYGVFISIILSFLISILSFFFNFDLDKTQFYLILLSLGLTTHYILGLIKIQFLIHKKNKTFALVDLIYNVLLIISVTILSYYFQEIGYAVSLIFIPLLVSLVFIRKFDLEISNSVIPKNINFTFWKYGFFASLSNVTTQLLVSIDIILIGAILNNLELVTAYKYISLIPYSFLFISQAIITTDFVSFTGKINDKLFIYNYIKNYMKIFAIISLGLIAIIHLFGSDFLSLFNKDYTSYNNIMLTLTIGISGILIFRGIFGNLLSSIGKAHINFYITSFALILNLFLNYFLIPKYGLFGAALTSALLMWLTGILSAVFFMYLYNLKLNQTKTTSPSPL